MPTHHRTPPRPYHHMPIAGCGADCSPRELPANPLGSHDPPVARQGGQGRHEREVELEAAPDVVYLRQDPGAVPQGHRAVYVVTLYVAHQQHIGACGLGHWPESPVRPPSEMRSKYSDHIASTFHHFASRHCFKKATATVNSSGLMLWSRSGKDRKAVAVKPAATRAW
jgi:hypothetical protein